MAGSGQVIHSRLTERRTTRDAIALQEVARVALSSLDPAELATQVVRDLSKRFRLRACSVWLLTDDGARLKQAAQQGFATIPDAIGLGEPSDAVTTFLENRRVARPDTSAPEVPERSRRVMDLLGPEAKAYVAMPLCRDHTPMGVLILVWPEPRPFEHDFLALLDAMATTFAFGFDHARLADRTARATQLLLAHLENSPLAVVEFSSDFRIVQWTDEATRVFGWTADEVLGRPLCEIPWVHPEDTELIQTESARLLDGTAPRSKNVNRNVRKDGRVIWCEWYSSAIYDSSGQLTSVLSLVLDITDRRHAEEGLRQELERTAALLAAAETLSSGQSLDDVLGILCDIALDLVGHTRVTTALWHDDEQVLEIVTSAGLKPIDTGARYPLTDLSDEIRSLIESHNPTLIDYDVTGHVATAPAQTRSPLRFVAPIVFRDRLLGMLAVDDADERRDFSARDQALIVGLASHAAVAIRNAQLYEQRTALYLAEQRRADYVMALNEIATIIHSSLEPDEIMQQVVELAAAAMDCESAGIALLDERRWHPRYVCGLPEDILDRSFTAAEFPLADAAAKSKRTAMISASRSDVEPVEGHYGEESLLATPLIVRGEVIGVFSFHYHCGLVDFSAEQVDFANRLAQTVSLALENARLFAAERTIADRLQSALLALPDEVPGITFAHTYRAATDASRVGGDFYDLFELNNGLVGVLIGDVAGKGLDAAVLTSLVKNSVRAHASERGKAPERILELTNEIVHKATPTEAFVTVFLGILDCRDGRLVYSNAGHTTAAVRRSDGTVARLSVTGPMLGAFAGVQFSQAETRLEGDDLLLLYTDGLTEARGSEGLYGEERLVGLLGQLDVDDVDVAVRGLVETVTSYAGRALRDDLAILALRRSPMETGAEQQKLAV